MTRIIILLLLCSTLASALKSDPRFYHKAKRNVFKISGKKDGTGGSGTAWALRYKNKIYTITNAHVCRIATNNKKKVLWTHRGNNKEMVTILKMDRQRDVCALTKVSSTTGYELATSWRVLQDIVVYGHPLGNSLTPAEGSMLVREDIMLPEDIPIVKCKGEHLKKEKSSFFGRPYEVCMRVFKTIYTNARIFPGSSGSPVLDATGNVVGMMFAGQRRTWYGYAVPLEEIREFMIRNF